jgi:hypothetical protein
VRGTVIFIQHSHQQSKLSIIWELPEASRYPLSSLNSNDDFKLKTNIINSILLLVLLISPVIIKSKVLEIPTKGISWIPLNQVHDIEINLYHHAFIIAMVSMVDDLPTDLHWWQKSLCISLIIKKSLSTSDSSRKQKLCRSLDLRNFSPCCRNLVNKPSTKQTINEISQSSLVRLLHT